MNPQKALRRLGAAALGLRIVRLLHVGVAKQSFLARRGGERYVLRVDLPLAARLGLDRRAEARVLQAACAGGVGPEPVAWRTQAPAVLLTRYLPGRAWCRADLDDQRRLEQLAALLRRTHAIAVPGRPLDLAAAASRYARLAGGGRALASEVGRLLVRAHDPSTRSALCHRDPIAGNVVGLRHPMLIDWEYAAAGDPLFDLAVVVEHHQLSRHARNRFLAAYFGGPAQVPAARLAAYGAVYRRLAALWRLAAFGQTRPEPRGRRPAGHRTPADLDAPAALIKP